MKLVRPRGRVPTSAIPRFFYWVKVGIDTLFAHTWLIFAIIGGISGYYIENTLEMLIFGVVVGAAIGYISDEGK